MQWGHFLVFIWIFQKSSIRLIFFSTRCLIWKRSVLLLPLLRGSVELSSKAHRFDRLRGVGIWPDHRICELLQHLLDLVSGGLGIRFEELVNKHRHTMENMSSEDDLDTVLSSGEHLQSIFFSLTLHSSFSLHTELVPSEWILQR